MIRIRFGDMTVIYLSDGRGRQVGPFENREGVERFIKMMTLCGENWADNEIIEGSGDDGPGRIPAHMDSCADRWKSANKLKLVGRKL